MKIDKEINLERILSEFLSVIDFKLCSFDNNNITIQDIKNPEELNQILNLPIDFTSNDNLRVFRSNKIKNDIYYINVLNTKYPKVPFSKNGIESFDIRIRKKDSGSEAFSSELFHNDSLYTMLIGKHSIEKYLCYREFASDEIIEIDYNLDSNNRKLEIYNRILPNKDKKIVITENISGAKHNAVLLVKENNQEVYRQELKSNELEEYFKALAYKSKSIVERVNDGVKTLNSNIYEMVLDYYDFATDFLNIVNNSNSSNDVIDILFEKYFNNSVLNKKVETPPSHTKKLKM